MHICECSADAGVKFYQINMPRFDMEYKGSGDLFAVLLLAWMHRHPHDLKVKY